MKSFGQKLEAMFLKKEAKLQSPTVEDIWNILKNCVTVLKVDELNTIGNYLFYGCLAKYEEEPIFEITFYFNDINSYYACCFTAGSPSSLERLTSEEVHFGKESGTLPQNFKDMESWPLFKEFKDQKLEYTLEANYD